MARVALSFLTIACCPSLYRFWHGNHMSSDLSENVVVLPSGVCRNRCVQRCGLQQKYSSHLVPGYQPIWIESLDAQHQLILCCPWLRLSCLSTASWRVMSMQRMTSDRQHTKLRHRRRRSSEYSSIWKLEVVRNIRRMSARCIQIGMDNGRGQLGLAY